MKYLYENGCDYSQTDFKQVIYNRHFECFYHLFTQYLKPKYKDSDNIVRDLHIYHNIPTNICSIIIFDDVNILKMFVEIGYEFDEEAQCGMAEKGYLDCLKYVYEHSDERDEMICAHAAYGGHLNCLRFLHEHGYKWTNMTTNYALQNGNYKCLDYAIENGCPE